MMLVSAPWVLPVCSPPIRDGAVLVEGARIARVGTIAELAAAHPTARRRHFDGCTILPGLVNAHTHLAMTSLQGVAGPGDFATWISRIPAAWGALSPPEIRESIARGMRMSLAAGVTVVGDISYGPDSPDIGSQTGIGGVFFEEVLGIPAKDLPARLYEMRFPARHADARIRHGLTPHAPYTAGPGLIAAAHSAAASAGTPFAIHVAESAAETELLASGTGPLAAVAARVAVGFEAPGTSAVRYLDALGVLDGALAIHCVKVDADDAALLAAKTRGVAVCPRSNAYLGNGAPPVELLLAYGVTLGLGTDSLASNADLDLFEEARALARIAPTLTAEKIVAIMTLGGAKALGVEGDFGTLERGKQADLAIFEVLGDDPHAALLAEASTHTLSAVLAAGEWRIWT